jgi:hypothetical protein
MDAVNMPMSNVPIAEKDADRIVGQGSSSADLLDPAARSLQVEKIKG